jgi:hypothetical protein
MFKAFSLLVSLVIYFILVSGFRIKLVTVCYSSVLEKDLSTLLSIIEQLMESDPIRKIVLVLPWYEQRSLVRQKPVQNYSQFVRE